MKIALICYAGMSTSLLVNRMRKAAKEQGLDLDIDAYSASDIYDVLEDVNVVLLGPQARYALEEVKSIAEPRNIPVDVIDSVMYGTMNAKGVLEKALSMAKK
jgi:PTS system cellobiose-specific IIB component